MEQYSQEQRRTAARAFIESLDQLQQTLQPSNASEQPVSRQTEAHEAAGSTSFDLGSFERAVADIEQFIERRSQPEKPSH
ncbi:hypothetical protein H6F43_11380 [Leptolyngbya sp. FACHB-36]|uniref:hypothetical protein n=1 Tax=Leptolyngbya sp. FACHB-36 TaxID=2692808 RepID=UPI001680348F|nr:hypothetical protein [Leptolyngbya sp. FACHB-36]MBD2020784.1 hypothetical protein [Leptolyngbya sp. FACHB-36]